MTEKGGAARRLVRRTDDRMVGGVCAGLADHFGTDPLLFRVGFVVLAVLGFAGVLLYGVAWALVPPADPAASTPARRALPVVGLVLVGVAAAAALPPFVDLMNIGFPFLPGDYGSFRYEPLALSVVLVGVGLALLRTRSEGGAAAAAEVTTARPVRARRERSGLAAITLAAVLLVLGGAGLLSGAGWIGIDVGQLSALALLLVGVGLVVGAWYGRARLLIVVGILMVPVVLVASLIDFPPTGTIGSPYLYVDRPGDLRDVDVLLGRPTLDLSDYDFPDAIERARLRVGAGSVTVLVPHDVRIDADVTVASGEAFVFGSYDSGGNLHVTTSGGPEDSPKMLDLDVEVGFGTVGIYRQNVPSRGRDDRHPRRRGRGDERPRRDRRSS